MVHIQTHLGIILIVNPTILHPFDKTLVIDTDFLVGNDNLLKCFKDDTLKINKDIVDCNPKEVILNYKG